MALAAPGGGGSPPLGGITETQPPEGPGHGRPVQPLGSDERLPQPPGGTGGGGLPQPPEGSGRSLRHPGRGGAPLLVVMVMVMVMVMEMVEEVDNLPLEEVGTVEVMVMVMVMEEVTLLHPLTQNNHDTANAEEIHGFT